MQGAMLFYCGLVYVCPITFRKWFHKFLDFSISRDVTAAIILPLDKEIAVTIVSQTNPF